MRQIRAINKDIMGLTMAELVMVMVVTAIISLMGVMSFRSSVEYSQLSEATDKLVSDMRDLRSQALRDQQSYTMSFDDIDCSYETLDGEGDVVPGGVSANLRGSAYRLSALTYQLDGGNTLTFDAQGEANPAGSLTLSRGDKEKVITISNLGRIEIADD